jgi:hypothetical protein
MSHRISRALERADAAKPRRPRPTAANGKSGAARELARGRGAVLAHDQLLRAIKLQWASSDSVGRRVRVSAQGGVLA